jgi:hypothetical protein
MELPMQSVSSLLLAGPSPSSPEAAETTPPPMQPLQCQHERLVGNMCPSLYLAVYRGRIADVTALLLEQPAVAIDCQATTTPGIKGNNLFILCFRVHIHLYTEINDARSFLKKKTEDWKKLIRNAFLTGATPLDRLTISFSN